MVPAWATRVPGARPYHPWRRSPDEERGPPSYAPAVGYVVDPGALVATLAAVMTYVTPEAMKRAGHKTRAWFP